MRRSSDVRLREQDGAGAVAEEDAGPPIAPVHDLGEGVGADDQRAGDTVSGADSIMLCATFSAKTKPAHTELTSNAGA